jgi:predicted nucleic acid-binding protein
MIILDTNVVSALMRPIENGAAVAWLDQQPSVSVWTTAITILEIRFGLMLLPGGRRRTALEQAFDAVIKEDLEDRVLAFDSAAADAAALLAVTYRRTGRHVDTRDIQIAGIAVVRKAMIATRNVKDFDDPSIPIINPWRAV